MQWEMTPQDTYAFAAAVEPQVVEHEARGDEARRDEARGNEARGDEGAGDNGGKGRRQRGLLSYVLRPFTHAPVRYTPR